MPKSFYEYMDMSVEQYYETFMPHKPYVSDLLPRYNVNFAQRSTLIENDASGENAQPRCEKAEIKEEKLSCDGCIAESRVEENDQKQTPLASLVVLPCASVQPFFFGLSIYSHNLGLRHR